MHFRKVIFLQQQTKAQGIMDLMREQNVMSANYFGKEELKLMLLHKAFLRPSVDLGGRAPLTPCKTGPGHIYILNFLAPLPSFWIRKCSRYSCLALSKPLLEV